jgi:hypothetical protein
MKTTVALLLVSSLAFADPPAATVTDSVTVENTDSPTIAPDLPGVSVRLRAGETAPYDGRLIALDENLRRGKALVDCRAELEAGKENAWVSKPVLIGLIIGSVALGAAAGAGVTAWALKRHPAP